MPRRTGRKCYTREAVPALDGFTRLVLTAWGTPFVPGLMDTEREIRQAWHQYGEQITAEYAANHPGTRPYAAYLLGLIELPPVRNPKLATDSIHHFSGRDIYSRTAYFGDLIDGWRWANWGANEAIHLHSLGIIDAEELSRSDKPEPTTRRKRTRVAAA